MTGGLLQVKDYPGKAQIYNPSPAHLRNETILLVSVVEHASTRGYGRDVGRTRIARSNDSLHFKLSEENFIIRISSSPDLVHGGGFNKDHLMSEASNVQENAPTLSAFADESSRDFSEQLDAVCRNNITHIELRQVGDIAVREQSLDQIRDIKKRADDAGIAFSAVGSGLGKCRLDDDLNEQIAICRHLVDIAHILETPYIRMFSFRIPEERTPEECREQVIDSLGGLIDAVSNTGVVLAHENDKGMYGDTAERCLELYETFYNTGVFKGIFDFANFIQMGQNPLTDCWPLLKGYTEYFHIKDARLEDGRVVPPGKGDGSLETILGEAIGSGFSSFLTLEPHLWPRYFGGTSETRFDIAANALFDVLKKIA